MKTYALVIFLLGIFATSAQPLKSNPGISPAPLDGGISLLLAAGAALGGRRMFLRHKSSCESNPNV